MSQQSWFFHASKAPIRFLDFTRKCYKIWAVCKLHFRRQGHRRSCGIQCKGQSQRQRLQPSQSLSHEAILRDLQGRRICDIAGDTNQLDEPFAALLGEAPRKSTAGRKKTFWGVRTTVEDAFFLFDSENRIWKIRSFVIYYGLWRIEAAIRSCSGRAPYGCRDIIKIGWFCYGTVGDMEKPGVWRWLEW